MYLNSWMDSSPCWAWDTSFMIYVPSVLQSIGVPNGQNQIISSSDSRLGEDEVWLFKDSYHQLWLQLLSTVISKTFFTVTLSPQSWSVAGENKASQQSPLCSLGILIYFASFSLRFPFTGGSLCSNWSTPIPDQLQLVITHWWAERHPSRLHYQIWSKGKTGSTLLWLSRYLFCMEILSFETHVTWLVHGNFTVWKTVCLWYRSAVVLSNSLIKTTSSEIWRSLSVFKCWLLCT